MGKIRSIEIRTTCKVCGKKLTGNKRTYCSIKCRNKVYYKRKGGAEYQREYLYRKRDKNTDGLIKCELCGRFYKFLAPHLRQIHEVDIFDYKKEYGIDRGRGLITDEIKKIKRAYVKETYPEIIQNNLIKNGVKTRYTKGDTRAGNYERSEETKKQLKNLYKTTKNYKQKYETKK